MFGVVQDKIILVLEVGINVGGSQGPKTQKAVNRFRDISNIDVIWGQMHPPGAWMGVMTRRWPVSLLLGRGEEIRWIKVRMEEHGFSHSGGDLSLQNAPVCMCIPAPQASLARP
jgi:hypothetical protein